MSNIYLASSATLQLYGHLSGANSIIQSNASSVNINFYGATSGHNATIFCNSGHTCNIKCHGDACDDLTLHHAGGDLNITCSNDAHKSDICPLGLEISSFMTQVMNMPEPNLFTNFTEFYLTGDSQCNSSDRVLCDERSACNYDDWSGNATSRALCCFGQISCQYSDWDSSTTGFATEIRCPGSISCEAVLNAGSGGNVYLTGYASGYDAEVTTTVDYNVYCTARISCQKSNIRSANNVYCLAYQACQNSGISGVNNVYSFAYNSLESGTVSDVSGNVYCNSYESCYRVRLTHIGGSVYAQGFLSLGQVDYVLNVQNIVAAFGYQAMYQLDLQNASAVYCDGTLCLQEGDVSSVPKIVVNGSDCLQDAFIQSDLFGKRTESYFSLEIYGSNSVEFIVECSANDICYIGCFQSDACTMMQLCCYGSCFVDCQEPDYHCPEAVQECGSYTVVGNLTLPPSNMPSLTPTKTPISTGVPTSIPSDLPSKTPTSMPTFRPTFVPTVLPTVLPTAMPTRMPVSSELPTNNPTTMPQIMSTNESSMSPPTTLQIATTEISSLSKQEETSTTSTTTSTISLEPTDDPDPNNILVPVVNEWDTIGTYVVVSGFCVMFLIALVSLCDWCFLRKKHGDNMNFISLFMFVYQIVDFWTDLSFCVILYYEERFELFYASVTFLIVPYLLSCINAIHYIREWHDWQPDCPERIKNWIQRFEILLLLTTLLAGFYSSVDLFRSKLFHHPVFYFPLKKEESKPLTSAKLINFVLLENIPQFVIQVYYLQDSTDNEYRLQPIVVIALCTSCLSIMLGILRLIRYIQHTSQDQKYEYDTKIHFCMTFEVDKSIEMHKWLAYCHNRFSVAIKQLFRTSHRSKWQNRSDVEYKAECYHISLENYCNEMAIWVEINILSTQRDLLEHFKKSASDMLDTSTANGKKFREVVATKIIGCKSIDITFKDSDFQWSTSETRNQTVFMSFASAVDVHVGSIENVMDQHVDDHQSPKINSGSASASVRYVIQDSKMQKHQSEIKLSGKQSESLATKIVELSELPPMPDVSAVSKKQQQKGRSVSSVESDHEDAARKSTQGWKTTDVVYRNEYHDDSEGMDSTK